MAVNRTKNKFATLACDGKNATNLFTLVVQRKRIDDDGNSQLNIFINSDDETVAQGRYIYRAIATNLDELSDSALVHWYNQHGETSENRLKELRGDFAAARLPCGDFNANASWLMLSSIAYNLFALMRMVLPISWSTCPCTHSAFASV